MCRLVLWGVLLGLLTACGLGEPAQPAPLSPSPTASAPAPSPTLPPPTPTPGELPDVVLLQFVRQGGVAGFCEELTITGAGAATLTSCRFSQVTGTLTPAEKAELRDLVLPYTAYEGGARADPNVPDDMTVWVKVKGLGRNPAPESVLQRATSFAQRVIARLISQAGGEAAVAPLTTYRQVATTAPHKALEVLVADLEAYLLQLPEGAASLRDPARQAALLDALRLDPSPVEPNLVVADADADGRDDLLVGPGAMGVPAVVLLDRGGTYRGLPLPAPDAVAGVLPAAWAGIHAVRDLSGDGRPEVVVTYKVAGASATTTLLFVVRLTTEDQADVRFFTAISDWGGPAEWDLLPDGTLRIVCPAFGVFDHKLLPHPSQTRLYTWSPARDRYVLEEVQETPPETMRQQINVAEAFIQQGRYEPALKAYRHAVDAQWLPEEELDVSLRSWALLRQAQILFAWGDPTARDVLRRAVEENEFARRLDAAFEDQDPLAPARAWLAPETLEWLSGGTNWPIMRPYEAFAPQLALAAVLNRRPDLLALESSALTASLQEAGVPVSRALIANLDNDPAAPELLVELAIQRSPAETYRFVVLMDQNAEAKGFGGVIVVHGGRATLKGLEEGQPSLIRVQDMTGEERRFAWDGRRLVSVDPPTAGFSWEVCRVGESP